MKTEEYLEYIKLLDKHVELLGSLTDNQLIEAYEYFNKYMEEKK